MTRKFTRIGTFLAAASAGLLFAAPGHARSASNMHWETLHVYRAEPSEVFSRLGLTHSTRYGHTLGQKHIADPSFPPGLTDVVPYDPGHTLLVRGTIQGLASFRARVAAADVPDAHWQLSVTLLRKDDDGGGPGSILAQQNKDIREGSPATLVFSSDGQTAEYEFTARQNRDGTLAITRRTSLTLSSAGTFSGASVFVPVLVWTRPVTEDTRLGDTLSFDDLATDRKIALQQIGQAAADPQGDYTVQIQITAEAPDQALTPALPAPMTGGVTP